MQIAIWNFLWNFIRWYISCVFYIKCKFRHEISYEMSHEIRNFYVISYLFPHDISYDGFSVAGSAQSSCLNYKLISPWTKWPTFLQTTFSNGFSWMKMVAFWFKFNWNLFPRVQLTASVQVIAWRRTGNKPLPKPMKTQFTDVYMRHWGDELVELKNKKQIVYFLVTKYIWTLFIWRVVLIRINCRRPSPHHETIY